jgi:hypothetical protein
MQYRDVPLLCHTVAVRLSGRFLYSGTTNQTEKGLTMTTMSDRVGVDDDEY